MVEKKGHDDGGLSARHLILGFLLFVAVCGVFFSLGFLVGYNERGAGMTPVTERVTSPTATPPVVNPPSESLPAETSAPNAPAEPPAKLPEAPRESKSTRAEVAASVSASSRAAPPRAESRAEPALSGVPHAVSSEVGVGFTVQVAASHAKEDAEALVKILKARRYPVFMVAPEYAHARDNLFRVQVGPFKTHEDAEKVRKQLAAQGFKPFIRH